MREIQLKGYVKFYLNCLVDNIVNGGEREYAVDTCLEQIMKVVKLEIKCADGADKKQ